MDAFVKGESTHAAVLAFLLKKDYVLALPIGVHRFDLLIKLEGIFKKAQVKTGRRRKEMPSALNFLTGTVHPVTGKRRPYSREDVDVFLVYDRVTEKLYKVPSELVVGHNAEFSLRLEPPRNNQKKNIHLASDFEL
jgi:hypothetical protein